MPLRTHYRGLLLSSAVVNLVQLVATGAFSIVMPFAIGFEDFGVFVYHYSAPAFLHGLVEPTLISLVITTGRSNDGAAVRSLAASITKLFLLLGFSSSVGLAALYTTLDDPSSTPLLIALTAGTCFLYFTNATCIGLSYIEHDLRFQAKTVVSILGFQAIVLAIGYALRWQTPLFPFLVIVTSLLLSIVVYANRAWTISRRLGPARGDGSVRYPAVLKYVLASGISRLFEDGILNVVPFIIFQMHGAVATSQFRLSMSINKLLNKAIPLRPEYFQSAMAKQRLNRTKVILTSIAFSIVSGLVLFSSYIYLPIPPQLDKLGDYSIVLLGGGFYCTSCLLGPLLLVKGLVRYSAITSVAAISFTALAMLLFPGATPIVIVAAVVAHAIALTFGVYRL